MPAFDYLLSQGNLTERTYIKQAASDGLISYSTTGADKYTNQWIDRYFEYIAKIVNVSFERSAGTSSELTFECKPITSEQWRLSSQIEHSRISATGKIELNQAHGQIQYGGVTDIRLAGRSVALGLGLSYPNDEPWNSLYNSDNTIMSLNTNTTYTKGDLGRSFFSNG
ncbi:MAG: hypothetical protein FJY58_09980 [Betaproteobacteria bacterium]|nr:hypothetical protein [Betaproteobacteria bacterium]